MQRSLSRFILLLVMLHGSARAAPDDAAPEVLVVTASRTPVPPDQVGSSLTMIPGDELKRRQVSTLADVLRGVPGFSVSQSGVPGSTTQIRVRGAEANQVLVLIDGVEANDPAQGGEFNFAHLSTYGIDRVEILRGPQSALWGPDALAGVINIITTRPGGGQSVHAFGEAGSFGTRRAGGTAGGTLDGLRYSLDGDWSASAGSNISRRGGEADGYRRSSVTGSLAYDPAPSLALELTARHTEAKNEFDGIDFVNTGLPVDANNYTNSRFDYARALARFDALGGHWQHRVSADFTGTRNSNVEDGAPGGSGRARQYKVQYQTSVFLDMPETWNATQTLSVAIEHQRTEYRQRGVATAFGDPNLDLAIHSSALAGEYRIHAGAGITLSASARHDNNSSFQDATTFRVTAAWSPREWSGTRLHAAFGEGSKNPSFSERFGFYADSPVPFAGNPLLRPEFSRGWEAGIDGQLLDRRLDLSATWFQQDLEDEIQGFVFDAGVGAFTARNAPGRSHRRGVELSFNLDTATGLAVGGAFTWLDATEPGGTGGQVEEVRRPRYSASLEVNYVFAADRGNLNLSLDYSGRQLDDYFPPFPRPAERVSLKSHTLATLAASWRVGRRVTVYGRVQNLLDQSYEEVLGFRAQGLGAFAGVRLDFDGG